MDDRGFWLGMVVAQLVNDLAFGVLIYSSDWEAIGQDIRATLEKEKGEKGEHEYSLISTSEQTC